MLKVLVLTAVCVATSALGKEATPEQNGSQDKSVSEPIGGGKPVKTVPVRPCPAGYEPVILTSRGDQRACAKDIVPANE